MFKKMFKTSFASYFIGFYGNFQMHLINATGTIDYAALLMFYYFCFYDTYLLIKEEDTLSPNDWENFQFSYTMQLVALYIGGLLLAVNFLDFHIIQSTYAMTILFSLGSKHLVMERISNKYLL